jgi:hypothetical protein
MVNGDVVLVDVDQEYEADRQSHEDAELENVLDRESDLAHLGFQDLFTSDVITLTKVVQVHALHLVYHLLQLL